MSHLPFPTSKKSLSVVIPAYNEESRLSVTLPQILDFFEALPSTQQIIISNDGSTDHTSQLINKFAKTHKLLKLVDNKINQGKGAALRSGIAASVGDWVLFMDADLSTPLAEYKKLFKFTNKYPVVIGSRKMSGALVVTHQSFIRENLGKVFTFLTNTIATRGLSDITCGFKLFKGDIARELFSKSVLNDWSFDAEVLFLAQKLGYKIKEVPVEWHNDPRTKVNMLKDGLKSLKGLATIRLNDIQGRY